MKAIPGVEGAGLITTLPLSGGPGFTGFQVLRSLPTPEQGSEPVGGMEVVSPGYFESMGIPLLSGRAFNTSDLDGSLPVAIVDEEFVRLRLGDRDPIGDGIRIAPPGSGEAGVWRQIVGVVGAVRYHLDQDPRPRMYLPEGQIPFALGVRALVVEARPGSEANLSTEIRAALREVDPLLSVESIQPLEVVARSSIARTRFQSVLLTVFAAIALILAAVGVYGVVAYAVARRTREVGLRLALGATGPAAVKAIIREAMKPVLIGLGTGIVAAAATARALAAITYGVPPLDPIVFTLGPGTLGLVALLATLIPGLRAMATDPVDALREP